MHTTYFILNSTRAKHLGLIDESHAIISGAQCDLEEIADHSIVETMDLDTFSANLKNANEESCWAVDAETGEVSLVEGSTSELAAHFASP